MEKEKDLKVAVQKFGRFLSAMVMPNIGAFIAWGIITALFIPTGWFPNESFGILVEPMVKYLLPLLIGYNGGKLVHGERGGVIGAMATMGVIVGTSIPMFIGAMIAGPVSGYILKKFDESIDGKIKSGFEMLVNNFSVGIIGMILTLVFYKLIGPFVESANKLLGSGVDVLVNMKLLPLTSIIVEPAKILFLNNAINHGVFSPLGIQQVREIGKSVFFLIETNPGPGLGVLLAYMFFGKGSSKSSAPGAAIIHFFGGIHEIYFPYILMNPLLLLAVIAGGMSGIFMNVLLGDGLIGPPSPGSIFAILALTPKGGFLSVIIGVVIATVVSFVIASIILKSSKNDVDLAEAQKKMADMKSSAKELNNSGIVGNVSKIVVACDAGMGSSAMGASVLRKKVAEAGLNISVTNRSISNLTEDIDIVITHQTLTDRAKTVVSKPLHLSIDNFMNGDFYDELVRNLRENKANSEKNSQIIESKEISQNSFKLSKENFVLNQESVPKEEALKNIADYMAKLGYVNEDYQKYILKREEESTTYIGNYVAIPHGTEEGKREILSTGIVVFQYPNGIDFGNGNIAYLLIGIAAKNDEHVDIISHIADIIEDEDEVLKLKDEKDIDKLYEIFSF